MAPTACQSLISLYSSNITRRSVLTSSYDIWKESTVKGKGGRDPQIPPPTTPCITRLAQGCNTSVPSLTAIHHSNLVSCTSWAVAVKLKKILFAFPRSSNIHFIYNHPSRNTGKLENMGDQAVLLPSPAYIRTWLKLDSSINQILIYQPIQLLSPDFPVQVSVQIQ